MKFKPMRKLILLMHTSLDGFVAGPNGEMDWIRFDEELADYVGKITDSADTALYGRITYEMMESYWPTAAESPTAMKHNLIDEYWINVNPVLLGEGTPLFTNISDRVNLKLVQAKTFAHGVVGLQYEV